MIHLYKNNGYNICLDVNSGSVHVIDDLTYDVLERMDQGKSADEIQQELSGRYDTSDISEAISECDRGCCFQRIPTGEPSSIFRSVLL